jgi:hypothetical protein
MNDETASQVELSKYNLSLTVGWIALADSKATFLLTITLAGFGAALTKIPEATRLCASYFACGALGIAWLLIATHIALYIAILAALGWLVNTVAPRLAPKSTKHSWFFFQSMGQLTVEDFHCFTDGLDVQAKLNQLNDQIYNNDVVARQKYKAIAISVRLLVIAVALSVVSIVPVLVLDALTIAPAGPK